MIPDHVTHAVSKALFMLPPDKIRRPEQARQRLPGLTTNQPVSEVRPMADANSTESQIHSRGLDGRPLYERACSGCGKVSLVKKRYLGMRCHACAMQSKRDPESVQVEDDARAFYKRVCRGCGTVSLASKKDKDRQCRQCALKARSTHGLASRDATHPLYRIIKSAQARCDYPAAKDYKWYGARGITVCNEWRNDPSAFFDWALANGWKVGLELDRRDNDGNYSPENCRFITHQENCRNKSNSRGRRCA